MFNLTEHEKQLLCNCFYAEWCRLDKMKDPKADAIKKEVSALQEKMGLGLKEGEA